MTSTQENSSFESKEALTMITEEEASPSPTKPSVRVVDPKEATETLLMECICKLNLEASKVKISPSHVEEILKKKEMELREEYEKILEREKENIKDRFDFILLNEQTRASYMLREAHRERQEKIRALQTQLQCKNLAALMYVMCTERRRSKMEKMKIIEDYTKYISVLHDILTRGQELILHLSRGYKTAARVDHEWREKMKKVVSEFMAFINHFAGGDPETSQYLIDLPKLLATKAPTEINSQEDPCDCDDEEEDTPLKHKSVEQKEWWEAMDGENRPFVMYGEMADLPSDRQRRILKQMKEAQRIRAQKTAPKEWKELSFRDMFLKSNCPHLDKIKDVYTDKLPIAIKWECPISPADGDMRTNSKMSIPANTRQASVDYRGTMGSILKIITLGPSTAPVPAKTELLGARDSMEITSTTKLRNSIKPQDDIPPEKVVLNIGKKRASVFVENETYEEFERETPPLAAPAHTHDDKTNDGSVSILGSIHNDSLLVLQTRNPEPDHIINYERICPMEKCQRMQVDSFMRTLPPYMRANPFTHFEQTFEQYETCTPGAKKATSRGCRMCVAFGEQLKMLQERIENRMHKKSSAKENDSGTQSPLSEWLSTGVAVQTSNLSLLPPCTCHRGASVSPAASNFILNLAHLESVKQAMDAVQRECLFDDKIDFDRFKVIGQDEDGWKNKQQQQDADFKETRYQEISEILEKHPSLLDIFQANAQ